MEKFMRQPEDLQRNDKMIKRYDKFCEEVKDITTTLCLTCLNITFKDRSTQALIEKYTGKTFFDGALRHQKLKLCKILLDKSSEIQMTLLHDKHGEMTEFEGYGMNRNDIHGALKLINYVRTIIFFKYINLSTWKGDIRKLDWFKYIKNLIHNNDAINVQGNAKNLVYHWFDYNTSFSYIGKTFRENRRTSDRWGEHLRDIMTPNKVEAELPCYKLIRKQGCVKHLICIGLFSVANCTNMTVRAWEIKMINQYQSKYHMPFLRQHLKDTTYIPERSRSDNTSYHTVGRHKNHAACSRQRALWNDDCKTAGTSAVRLSAA